MKRVIFTIVVIIFLTLMSWAWVHPESHLDSESNTSNKRVGSGPIAPISDTEIELIESIASQINWAVDKENLVQLTPDASKELLKLSNETLNRIEIRYDIYSMDNIPSNGERFVDRIVKAKGIVEAAKLLLEVSNFNRKNPHRAKPETSSGGSGSFLAPKNLPRCEGGDSELLTKTYYTNCYRTDWKIPFWVAYRLDEEQIRGNTARNDSFRIDPTVDETKQAKFADYVGSKFDRGHMVPPSAFRDNQLSNSEAFLMTNVAPQTPAFNRIAWRKIEKEVQRLADPSLNVWVYAGNIVSTGDERNASRPVGDVRVPTHSWMAILTTDKISGEPLATYGFLVPNVFGGLQKHISAFEVSIDELEDSIDLDIFSSLEDYSEEMLEAEMPEWPPDR